VVVAGRFELLLPEHEQVFAYTRTLDAASRVDGAAGDGPGAARDGAGAVAPTPTLLVVANMSSEPAAVVLPGRGAVLAGELLLTTHADGAAADGEHLRLAPWESRVYLA
jgi:oligo-1,6-glucosidase